MKLAAAAAVLMLMAGLAQARPAEAAAPAGRTTTLITGDLVTLAPDGGVSVAPGPGRAGIPMLTSTVAGKVRVIPADAVRLLRAGRLDPRLFDVTGLLADGYDGRRADLPLIASADSGVTGTVMRRMSSVRATAVHTRNRDLGRLWATVSRPGAPGKVWLDAIGHFTGAEGVQQIGAPAAWQAGLTGRGMTVALIDSGVDVTHPDLAGRVAAQVDFAPVADGGSPSTQDVHDRAGHGTHVASIMAGSGAASGGRYRGVAPDATIVSAKVGDYDAAESAVIAAMEWAAGTRHAPVVNMSLGFPDAPGDDPVEAALNDLTARYGTLFVVAAGNDGNNGNNPNAAGDYDVLSPSTADAALSVGAVDHDDQVAVFSSRGPRIGDDAVKPEITAPGVDITGARSADAPGTGPYDTGYGTSYAAPHVTGSGVLVKQAHPDWTGAMLKAALMGTARPAAGVGVFAQGAGRVDVAAALGAPVLADPPVLSSGARTVTYRNPGAVAQRLSLRAGSLRLSARALTVPAGGSARVTVTASGPYSGFLIATTASGKRVSTPIGLTRPAVTHRLTLHHVGADGQPTLDYYTTVVGLDTPFVWDSLYHYGDDYSSDVTLSVPAGHYAVVSQLFGDSFAVLARPSLAVDADAALTLDARAARPVQVTVPAADAVSSGSGAEVGIRNGGGGWVSVGGALYGSVELATAQLGEAAPGVVSLITAAFGAGSDAYQLAWYRPGSLPTGLTRTVTAGRLAVDRTSVRTQTLAGSALMRSAPIIPGYPIAPVYTPAPLATTRYFNTDGGIGWTSQVFQYSDDDVDYYTVTTTGAPAKYRAGRTYASVWNAPVVAPCPAGGGWSGDQLAVRIAPFCDSAGHPGLVEQETPAGTTTLYRDGKEVATADVPGHALFTVRPAGGVYRLSVDATRAASFGLSTHVTADWTFTDRAAAAHLPAVRMAPVLDDTGAAPAGRAFTVPIAAGAGAVTVRVSYDDGATWAPAAVTRTGKGTFAARVVHPAAAGFVSLRVHAGALTETVIHAYRIRTD